MSKSLPRSCFISGTHDSCKKLHALSTLHCDLYVLDDYSFQGSMYYVQSVTHTVILRPLFAFVKQSLFI